MTALGRKLTYARSKSDIRNGIVRTFAGSLGAALCLGEIEHRGSQRKGRMPAVDYKVVNTSAGGQRIEAPAQSPQAHRAVPPNPGGLRFPSRLYKLR
jgi:hypothetical protein